jgi:hypothetical protein
MNRDESVESGRLRRLPPRLRVAHLAALVRSEADASPRAAKLKHLLAALKDGPHG